MNECLVTTLKGVVNDNSLRKLGEIRFSKNSDVASSADSCYVAFDSPEDLIVEILNDGQFCLYSSGTPDPSAGKVITLLASENQQCWVTPGSLISVRPKYNMTRFTCIWADINLSEFFYMSNLDGISLSNGYKVVGDLSMLSHLTKLKTLSLNFASQVTGNVSSLAPLVNLESVYLNYTELVGNVSAFGVMTKLITLMIGNSNIIGSIESLVAAQIAAGRTTGTIIIPYIKLTKLTYEGQSVATNVNVPANSETNAISWTSNGTITWIE